MAVSSNEFLARSEDMDARMVSAASTAALIVFFVNSVPCERIATPCTTNATAVLRSTLALETNTIFLLTVMFMGDL
jgi:hypothetical protein